MPTDGFVPAGSSLKGKLYRKQILKLGKQRLPNGKDLMIDQQWLNQLVSNFESRVIDHVQIPAALDDNSHTEDPERNLGEVVGLESNDDGLYALMDFRKDSVKEAPGSTILGASAGFIMDYTDGETGEKKGPVLLHVCATNRPHVKGMDGYSELIAASSDLKGQEVVFLSSEEEDMTKVVLKDLEGEELKAALESEFGIEDSAAWAASLIPEAATAPVVIEPSEELLDSARAEGRKELVDALSAVLSGDSKVSLSDSDSPEIVALSANVTELAETNSKLSAQVADLTLSAAKAEVENLVNTGYILPKSADTMVQICLSNREQFDALIPEAPIVDLATHGEDAVELTGSQSPEADEEATRSEINRVLKEHNIISEKV